MVFMFLLEFELLNNMWVRLMWVGIFQYIWWHTSTSHLIFFILCAQTTLRSCLAPRHLQPCNNILRYWRPMRRMCDGWIMSSIGSEPTGRKDSEPDDVEGLQKTSLPKYHPYVCITQKPWTMIKGKTHSNIPLDPTKKHYSEQRIRCSHYLAQSKAYNKTNICYYNFWNNR